MKQTITELAEIAVSELNQAALLMHRQMQSGELDKPTADKSIKSAQAKAKAVHNAYFSRRTPGNSAACENELQQRMEFDWNGSFDKFIYVNDRFGKVLKHYAKAVGASITNNLET